MDWHKVALVLGVLVLVACSSPEKFAVPECKMFGVRAWIDENENGSWDEGELPLPGVVFSLAVSSRSSPTDKDGLTAVGDCWTTYWEKGTPVVEGRSDFSRAVVRPVEIPSGYRLTTKPYLRVGEVDELSFGFAPVATQAP
jgi:hypothetical protein